jgi:hypothetical protein
MRTLKYFVLAALAVAAVSGFTVVATAAKADALEIGEIMEKAHTPPAKSLFKTVVTGKANQEQKEELLKLYSDLPKNKPPKGSEEDWKKRTDAIVTAAKAVVENKPNCLNQLKTAVNCKACHDLHKGE